MKHRAALSALLAVLAALTLAYAGPAGSAEIKSLAWDELSPTPAVHIGLSEDAAYETQSLDGGQRLRIGFPQASLSPTVSDIDGRGSVKGVYPYVAENGNAVHIDLLMTEPARMKVEKMSNGYRVLALSEHAVPAAGAPPAEEASAAEAPAVNLNTLEEVIHSTLPGGRVQIQLKMSQTPAEPASFSQNNPPRISLDFPNTRTVLAKKNVRINEGAVLSLNAVESQNRTRVVLNLVRPAAYSAKVDGNAITLLIENPAAAVSGSQATHAAKTVRFADPAKPGKHALANIDFRRGAQGEGKIIIGLSDSGVGIDIREQGGEVVIDFHDTNAPPELLRRLNVTDFATPVQHIDTFAQGKNTRMVISALGKYEHLAYQVGEVLTISVKPLVEKLDKKKVDEFGYSGEKLSLNFQNIEVRAALQVIADFTGLNLVVADTVKGTLTMRLKDVPWDQALDIILNAKGLAKREKGNVVSIAPIEEVAAKEKAALEASKHTLELEPLVSELIQINYAKADDIAKLLKSIKAVETTVGAHPVFGARVEKLETESNTLLSPRGQVTVDARTNSLLIQDTPGKIREVRKLIAQLDQPVRQVMIETRLVEATDDFSRNLGMRFGAQASRLSGGIQTTVDSSATGSGGLNVNLPAAGIGTAVPGSIALTIARLGTGDLLNLELSALEAAGRGKVISSPRLITANQKKARIEQGQERAFTTSVLGVGSVVTKKAVLALEVTPQITPDERVILDVLVTKDAFANPEATIINKKEITTQVLLDNGETVMIGGIYEQTLLTSTSKVPFLGDLPVIGWAFKNNSRTDNKIELLIFLTPRILSDALSLR
jgi:type IV pilus assembly protein PilQ